MIISTSSGFLCQEEKEEEEEDDDDFDMFGSDDEEDEEAEKIKQERVAAYAAKKSKKPALIAKSSVLLGICESDDVEIIDRFKRDWTLSGFSPEGEERGLTSRIYLFLSVVLSPALHYLIQPPWNTQPPWNSARLPTHCFFTFFHSDVKPWDDETDMKEMESLVRTIEMDGLLWGQARLAPIGYGISKLVINCVVEDDKVRAFFFTNKNLVKACDKKSLFWSQFDKRNTSWKNLKYQVNQ